MATLTYKCPNCNGGLIFDPDSQNFECEYCASRFTEAQLSEMNQKEEQEEQIEGQQTQTEEQEPQLDGTALYICPSCGAEIVSDETTAATFCFYCHNPIVLSERLSGEYTPDSVIPFSVSKEQAIERFFQWVGKRKFVPDEFVSEKQLETITGIYFPHWVADYKLTSSFRGRARKTRTWTSGNKRYTETKHYQVARDGDISFEEIVKNALTTEHVKLLDSVQPFEIKDAKQFLPAYLSGFQAEKRNIEYGTYIKEVAEELKTNSDKIIRSSISGYSVGGVSGNTTTKIAGENWKYTLLPVWILTYKDPEEQLYHFAMNGQTGKATGIIPLDKQKLKRSSRKVSLITFAFGAAFVLLGIIGGLLA